MFKFSAADLKSVIHELKTVADQDKKSLIGLHQKRINTVLPGALIHYFLLHLLGKQELVISTRTISDGLIYRIGNEE